MVEKRNYVRTDKRNVKNAGTNCIGPLCERPAKAKRLCMGHYKQIHRGGHLSPLGPVGRRPSQQPVENADTLVGFGYEEE